MQSGSFSHVRLSVVILSAVATRTSRLFSVPLYLSLRRQVLRPRYRTPFPWIVSCSGSSFADGETLNGGLLLGHAESGLVGLGDLLGPLDAVELNMAV